MKGEETVRTRAAIMYEANKPLKLEEVELDAPKDEEVLVKMVATGICHTDLHNITGVMPVPGPIVLGHEGAGIVEKVGSNVTEVKPGDKVVLAVTPSCGKCHACLTGKSYICERVLPTAMATGCMADGTKRLKRKNGEELCHFMCQSSFAEYAVVEEEVAVKVPDDTPLDIVCLLGCGGSTGIGGVVKKARVEPGSSVAVFGCGGVGLSAIMAARLAGALRIFAVDIADNKLEKAKELGATDLINSSKEDPVQKIRDTSGGGVDYSFEAVGNSQVIAQAFHSTCRAGTAVVLGMAPFGSTVTIDNYTLLEERVLTGCGAGHLYPRIDIPRYVNLFRAGKLPLDKLVSARYPFEQINTAIKDALDGKVMRAVIKF